MIDKPASFSGRPRRRPSMALTSFEIRVTCPLPRRRSAIVASARGAAISPTSAPVERRSSPPACGRRTRLRERLADAGAFASTGDRLASRDARASTARRVDACGDSRIGLDRRSRGGVPGGLHYGDATSRLTFLRIRPRRSAETGSAARCDDQRNSCQIPRRRSHLNASRSAVSNGTAEPARCSRAAARARDRAGQHFMKVNGQMHHQDLAAGRPRPSLPTSAAHWRGRSRSGRDRPRRQLPASALGERPTPGAASWQRTMRPGGDV